MQARHTITQPFEVTSTAKLLQLLLTCSTFSIPTTFFILVFQTSTTTWLYPHLLKAGISPEVIALCEQKLVRDENLTSLKVLGYILPEYDCVLP